MSEAKKNMEADGWVVVCESPYELEHEDGGTATGYGATLVEDAYIDKGNVICSYCDKTITVKDLNQHLTMKIQGGGLIHWNCDDVGRYED